jgi:hypothetical protein
MPLPTIGRDVSPARRKALRSLAGKAVLFLDTCHAAGAVENGSRRGLASPVMARPRPRTTSAFAPLFRGIADIKRVIQAAWICEYTP